jgi:hypothetical protein
MPVRAWGLLKNPVQKPKVSSATMRPGVSGFRFRLRVALASVTLSCCQGVRRDCGESYQASVPQRAVSSRCTALRRAISANWRVG